jgi:hypothetical protein
MNIETYGGVQIFRPSFENEAVIRQRARSHLRARFSPGEYRGAEFANAVIQHQFQFYDQLLQAFIPKLVSREAAEFLLFQFDQATRILHGNGIQDENERSRWSYIEPCFKRAIKYLVELICIHSMNVNGVVKSKEEAVFTMGIALIAAENCVLLGQHSELVHSIFPKESVLVIFEDGPLDYEIRVEGRHDGYDNAFGERVARDRQARDQFVGFPQFDNHTATHQKYLDEAFTGSFGMSYGHFIACITSVIDGASPTPAPEACPALFIHRGHVVNELVKSLFENSKQRQKNQHFCMYKVNIFPQYSADAIHF